MIAYDLKKGLYGISAPRKLNCHATSSRALIIVAVAPARLSSAVVRRSFCVTSSPAYLVSCRTMGCCIFCGRSLLGQIRPTRSSTDWSCFSIRFNAVLANDHHDEEVNTVVLPGG
jgi:hypothetical protein